MVAQVGHFYSDEVGQYYSGANNFAPSVLLGTVDKLAAIGQSQGTIRKFFGMFGFAPWYEPGTNRLHIPRGRRDFDEEPGTKYAPLFPSYSDGQKRFFDPYPALLIQDEAHLLDESLGTFAGLFETALQQALEALAPLLGEQLCRAPGSEAPRRIKVIAASATVNDPEHQMHNLYQRPTVQFPYPGPELYSSFYAAPRGPNDQPEDAERCAIDPNDVELRSHWGRMYRAILSNGQRHTVAVAAALSNFHFIITGLYERLRSGEPAEQQAARDDLVRWLPNGPLRPQFARVLNEANPASLLTLIDLHRISLTYVTTKKGGDQVLETEKIAFDKLHRTSPYAEHRLSSDLISGAVDAGHIGAVVKRAQARVEEGKPFPPLNDTLRSIIATSAVSHGVDVDEFNTMFFAGMPADIAEYIQASSRVGRTHVGFSLLLPTPQRSRDRYVVEVFESFHRFLERMILPAAIDRWAEKALVRVIPSFFQTYICAVKAIRDFAAADAAQKRFCRNYRDANQVHEYLEQGPERRGELAAFIGAALGLAAETSLEGRPYYEQLVRDRLRTFADDLQVPRLAFGKLQQFFELRSARERPMTSLRDVDEPGVIRAARTDVSGRFVDEERVAQAMNFIRCGTGADIDDVLPEKEKADLDD